MTEYYAVNKKKRDGTPYIYHFTKCKKCVTEMNNDWARKNRDKQLNYVKKYYDTEKGKDNKKENYYKYYENGKRKEWEQNNKDKIREYRKYREMNKTHEISKEEWENCKNYFNYRCAYCELPIEKHFRLHYGKMKQFDLHKEHVDHEGLNDLSNCIPSCQSCNSSKRDYKLEEWYSQDNENFSQERLDKIHRWLTVDFKKYIE